MTVPVAAINKKRGHSSREHEVWRSGQVPAVQPEPQSEVVGDATDCKLRARIAAFDVAHHRRSFRWGDDIHLHEGHALLAAV